LTLGADTDNLRERLRTTPRPAQDPALLAELTLSGLPEPRSISWLVLDDYHHVVGSQPAETYVETIASDSRLNILVSSRTRPAWASIRRLIYGEIIEIGVDELAMSPEEAARLLGAISSDDARALITLAEGWPAILSLAALVPSTSLRNVQGAIDDFLTDEVCRPITASAQDSLALLTELPWVSVELASALLTREEAEHAVEEGLNAGILHKTASGFAEFHPLVRDFLAKRLEGVSTGLVRSFEAKAVSWFLERDHWDEAFEIVQRSSHRSGFSQLIERALRPALKRGRIDTVRRWVTFARQEGLRLPGIEVAEAELAFRDGAYLQAETLAAQAAAHAPQTDDHRGWAYIIAGRASHLAGRELDALSYFRAGRDSTADASDARVAALGELASSIDLELPEAVALLDQLRGSKLQTPRDVVQLATHALMLQSRGATLDALQHAQAAAQLLGNVDDPLVRASFRNVYAYACALAAEYDDATRLIDAQMVDIERHHLYFASPYAEFARALISFALRQFDVGFAHIRSATEGGRRNADTYVLASVAAIRARALIALGRFDEAMVSASFEHSSLIKSMRGELLATRALAEICANQPNSAAETSNRASLLSKANEVVVITACVEAITSLTGKQADVDARCHRLVSLIVEHRYVDGFIAAYRGFPELARHLATLTDHRAWLRDTMERAQDHELIQLVGAGGPDDESRNLSKREAEVYGAIRRGLSNRAIATELFISEATVKVHVRNICRKLGVRTRTQAAVRASNLR